MERKFLIVSLCTLVACSTPLQVAKMDERTGLLQSATPISKATIIISKKISLAPFKGMAFVSQWGPDKTESVVIEQIKAINYFDQVLNPEGLYQVIASYGLQDKVGNVEELIGLNRLYHKYKPFLWIHFKNGESNIRPTIQLIVTNPDNLEDVFVSQADMSFWNGVTNEDGFYPLINSLIEWINQNR